MATIEQAGTTAMPPYFGTVLRNGSSGPDSAQVQTWLNGVHTRWPQVPSVTVDGQYGSNTANAVKAFQTVAGLTADGKVGYPPGTPSTPPSRTSVARGRCSAASPPAPATGAR